MHKSQSDKTCVVHLRELPVEGGRPAIHYFNSVVGVGLPKWPRVTEVTCCLPPLFTPRPENIHTVTLCFITASDVTHPSGTFFPIRLCFSLRETNKSRSLAKEVQTFLGLLGSLFGKHFCFMEG